MWRNYSVRLGLLLFAIMLIVGCTQANELSVEDIWARPGIQDANSAVYFIITNTTGESDTLLSAESDIATAVELHESTMKTVVESQGEMAKLISDESYEHMDAHHEDGCTENHDHEECEYSEDHHGMTEHHDHSEDGGLEDHECGEGEHTEDHHGMGEHHDHSEDSSLEDHECEESEHHDAHHENVDMGSSLEGSMDANMAGGVMMMVQQENVPVGAKSQIKFKPGGLHVMLIGLNQDLKPGDTFQVTLNFEKAGQITMDVPVKQP